MYYQESKNVLSFEWFENVDVGGVFAVIDQSVIRSWSKLGLSSDGRLAEANIHLVCCIIYIVTLCKLCISNRLKSNVQLQIDCETVKWEAS